MDVAAVQAEDQRQVWAGQFLPVLSAGVDEAEPFLTELVLQPLLGGVHPAAHCAGVQCPAQREDLTEQISGQSVGDQAGEAGLQGERDKV